MAIGIHISIITLNVNGLNVPTKDMDQLNGYVNKNRQKVRGWKKLFHANGNQKKAGVVILISDKIDLKIKTVIRDKEGHYITIKGSIQEEDVTIVNIDTQHRST